MLNGQLQEVDEEDGAGRSTRMPNIHNVRNAGTGLLPDEFASFLEPLFRKVVREEVERAIPCFCNPSLRAPSDPVGTSEESSLRLQFVTKLPAAIFTNSQIEDEDGNSLRIELVDGRTNERVASGPLSSIKIEIVALSGDFGSDEGEDWTEKEFNGSITREREGKRPLITGELTAMLQEGIGCLGNLIFTDNSSWMRCRKFRLGARAVKKVSAEIRIREARSDSFVVKDHRGELNKKHHPPSLSDEVWRLEKVAKDGTLQKRMISKGINTVQEFLQLYEVDASSLRNIIGNRVADRIWETMVKHARTCVVDNNKMYAYYQASNLASIVFNSVMKVSQATLNGQTYQSLDKLTYSQKILVQNLRRQAYHNKNQWVPLDALSSISPRSALTSLPTESIICLSPLQHHLDYTVPNQDRPEVTPELTYSLASHCCNVTEDGQLDFLKPQSHIIAKVTDQTEVNGLARQGFASDFSAGISHPLGYSQEPFVPNIHLSPEELLKGPSPVSTDLVWTPEHTFVIGSSSGANFRICPSGRAFRVRNSRISKPRAAWCKIRAVVKWLLVQHAVAAKRTAMLCTSSCIHGESHPLREFWVLQEHEALVTQPNHHAQVSTNKKKGIHDIFLGG